MSILETIQGFAASVASAVVSVFGVNMATEQPRFEVLERIGDGVEIRRYAPRIAGEATVTAADATAARREAFGLIAGYIFGANAAAGKVAMTAPVEVSGTGSKIAMTAPVEVGAATGGLTMRFFMPAAYTMATLPRPTDSRVQLTEIPAATVEVLRFSGSTGDAAVAERTGQLLAALQGSAWRVSGPQTAYFYNPPWTIPALRTNEVVVPVAAN
jgi:hypothetical protein